MPSYLLMAPAPPQTDDLPQFHSCKSGAVMAGVLTQVCKLDCGPESHSHPATSVPPFSHVEVFLFPVLGNDRKMQASPGLSWRPCSQTVGEIIKHLPARGQRLWNIRGKAFVIPEGKQPCWGKLSSALMTLKSSVCKIRMLCNGTCKRQGR